MRMLADIADRFRQDEDGAAMIEYSILIGIIAAASITVVIAIGLWVTGRFTDLCTDMASAAGTCVAATGVGS